jgi:predicted ester cyclase
MRVEPFVALMHTYCIDYTNSHDLSVCDSIMEPDYVVHIAGASLERDPAYKPAVEATFARFPGLGLVVHELVTNGDRLVMRFSEHGATPAGALACWAGIGLYDWNGTRLTTCRVEQDFWSQRRQLRSGVPDPLEPAHLDPWTTTTAAAPDPAAEAVVRGWLAAGDLRDVTGGRVDEASPGEHVPVVDVDRVEVLDLFSAGLRVAFHASFAGRYAGGLDGIDASGQPASVAVAGLATVAGDRVTDLHAVTDRFGTSLALARTSATAAP